MSLIRALVEDNMLEMAQTELKRVVEMYCIDYAPFQSHLLKVLSPECRARLVQSVRCPPEDLDIDAIDCGLYSSLVKS